MLVWISLRNSHNYFRSLGSHNLSGEHVGDETHTLSLFALPLLRLEPLSDQERRVRPRSWVRRCQSQGAEAKKGEERKGFRRRFRQRTCVCWSVFSVSCL